MEEILERLVRPRDSLSEALFTEEHFRGFKRADTFAAKEHQVVTCVIPYIEGDNHNRDIMCDLGEISFTNLQSSTDQPMVAAKPDFSYGARPEKLDHEVYEMLNTYIVPSTQGDFAILPNFFLAVKGPDGTLAVAIR